MSVVGSPITVGASSKKFNSNAVAEAYSAAQAYAVGDYATWKGNLYKNKTAIPLPGEAWNAEHWEPVTLDEEMALFDGLVIASETQPTNGRNKIWFRLNGSEVSIPEMADLHALMEAIAAREDSNTATRAYTVGDLIFIGTALYKATGDIAAGALIVPGTNVRGTTIEAQLGGQAGNDNIPNAASVSSAGVISFKHGSVELFTLQLPIWDGSVSNGT